MWVLVTTIMFTGTINYEHPLNYVKVFPTEAKCERHRDALAFSEAGVLKNLEVGIDKRKVLVVKSKEALELVRCVRSEN